jgi:hypothetical protein
VEFEGAVGKPDGASGTARLGSDQFEGDSRRHAHPIRRAIRVSGLHSIGDTLHLESEPVDGKVGLACHDAPSGAQAARDLPHGPPLTDDNIAATAAHRTRARLSSFDDHRSLLCKIWDWGGLCHCTPIPQTFLKSQLGCPVAFRSTVVTY